MKKKFSSLVLLLTISALMLSACTATNNNAPSNSSGTSNSASESQSGSTEPKVLTYAVNKEPGTLDSGKSQDDLANEILYHIGEGLIRTYNNEIVPGIAETWDTSEDGLTYTFHLRDSTWSDGTPFTAKDFEYSFLRFIDPATGSAFVESIYSVVGAEEFNKGELTDKSQVGIKALDEKTLEIKLKQPVSFFLNTIASNSYFYPVKQEWVEAHGDQYAAEADKMITNGPFTLTNWVHESELVMVKNENYWNKDTIKLDGITQLIVPDANTVSNMFDSGQIDYISDIAAQLISKYPLAQGATTGTSQMLQFNVEGTSAEAGKLMSNKNFHKALSYAVDRNGVANAVAAPGSKSANRFTLPTTVATTGTYHEQYPFEGISGAADIDQAKAFLETALSEAGMTIDQLPKLTYVAMEGRQKLYAEALQDAWKTNLGLNNIEISVMPTPQAIQATMNREYDIYVQSLDASEDASSILGYWLANGSINWTGWNDETYTAMYNDAMAQLDQDTRYAGLFETEKYLYENGPLEPFIYPGISYITQDFVKGVVRSPLGASSQLLYVDLEK